MHNNLCSHTGKYVHCAIFLILQSYSTKNEDANIYLKNKKNEDANIELNLTRMISHKICNNSSLQIYSNQIFIQSEYLLVKSKKK